jgi:hypothetical protein
VLGEKFFLTFSMGKRDLDFLGGDSNRNKMVEDDMEIMRNSFLVLGI